MLPPDYGVLGMIIPINIRITGAETDTTDDNYTKSENPSAPVPASVSGGDEEHVIYSTYTPSLLPDLPLQKNFILLRISALAV